jgi:hypothetical protein
MRPLIVCLFSLFLCSSFTIAMTSNATINHNVTITASDDAITFKNASDWSRNRWISEGCGKDEMYSNKTGAEVAVTFNGR